MKRSVLVKYALMFGLASGSAAYGQVFNVHNIQHGYAFYGGYNVMAFGQGAASDPGNNIWNGFGDGGGPGSTDSFGGGHPNDNLLPNNPGNPYAWSSAPYFAHGLNLFSPSNAGAAGTGNATSAGVWTPVTVPVMDYGFNSGGVLPSVDDRTNVAEWVFSEAAVVNGGSPGSGTAAAPLGTMVLSNVPAGIYALFLYGANYDGTRGASFAVDSGTPVNGVNETMNPYPAAGSGPETNFVLGVDYVIYNNVTPDPDSTIHISWGAVSNIYSGLNNEGDFNGLQLITAPPVPTFLLEPSSTTVSQGSTASLSALALGNPNNIAYRWYSGSPPGVALAGQTNASLVFSNAQAAQSGDYFVVATNAMGAQTSSVVEVTIIAAPLLVGQYSTNGLILYSGQNAFTLSVSALGASPLYYYWLVNGVTAGITTNVGSYQFVNLTAPASYSCLVSNSYSTAVSLPLPLTVVSPPSTPYITSLLALRPIAYWPLTETNASGTTAYDYIGGNNGTYVGNFTPGVPGPAAGFGANSYAFGLNLGQGYIDVPAGAANALTANALNITGPMTMITWIQGDAALPPDFTTIAGKGDQSYRQDVDPSGFAHFADPGPDAQGGPIVCESSWHMIVGVYTGTNESLYVDGALADKEVTSTKPGDNLDFWIGGAPDYPGGRNFYGSIAHVALFTNVLSPAQVQALFTAGETPPFIALEPTNYTGYLGGNASFTVGVSGYQPISYQWFGPGGSISGATSPTLQLTDLNFNDSGTYYCVITNEFGSTNTPEDGSVALNVSSTGPAFVYNLPTLIYGIIGSPLTLSPGEVGNVPIANQWYYGASSPPTTALNNGGRISGATSAVLVINNAQLSDEGYYQLDASNSVSTAATGIGQLLLEAEPAFNTNGAGWVVNGSAQTGFNNNVLTLTTAANNEASDVFFDTPVYVGAFEASFTYQAGPGSSPFADGMTFCLQNSAAGPMALGKSVTGGNALGYTSITNSWALAIDLYNAQPGGFETLSGGAPPDSPAHYTILAPSVVLTNGNPVVVSLVYKGDSLSLEFTDTVTHGFFATNIVVGSIPGFVGGSTAYPGFTGATGGLNAQQTVSNFSFVPLPTLTAAVSGTNLVLSWPVGVGGYVLEKSTSLKPANWTTISGPYNIVGQNYQVVVPASSPTAFYRLAVTP